MARRPGLTLTEVLVTLAILSFGILAILTLFPLAASQMAVAVREDRSAQAANAADGYMRAYWKSEIVAKSPSITEPFFAALDNPNTNPTTGAALPILPPDPNYHVGALLTTLLGGRSAAVFVDPIGFASRSGGGKVWAGDGGASDIPRRTMKPFFSNPQYAFRSCSLMDGMGYDDNGRPTPDRELRYNWMWLLQRPDVNDKLKADMTVIVFDNRPNMYAPSGSEASTTTLGVGVGVVTPGSNSLSLTLSLGGTPDVKPGMWIVDVSDPIVSIPPKVRQVSFYQVTSATPGSGSSVDLQLNTPVVKDPLSVAVYMGKFIVLKGVSGVYPRPPLTGE